MEIRPQSWTIDKVIRQKSKIDPKPQYQTGRRWTDERRKGLIDSIIRGYDVPKIYLRKIDGHPTYNFEVIDGQQRLTAIWEFSQNSYRLPDTVDSINGFEDAAGKLYSEFSEEQADKFHEYELSVVSVLNATDSEIAEMFLRLNKGVPLNPAEKRKAIPGHMAAFVRSLVNEPPTKGFFGHIGYRADRDNHYDLAAVMVCLELAGRPTAVKSANLDRMYYEQADFNPNGEKAKKIKKVLGYMQRMFSQSTPETDVKWGLVDLYLLISSVIDDYSIGGMEPDLRRFYIDMETDRRRWKKDPQALLDKTERTKWDEDLFQYINVFDKDYAPEKSIQIRHDVYRNRFHREFPELMPKDPKRLFTTDERLVIWRIADQTCASCGELVSLEDMDADHIIPHSRGGKTVIANGQCLHRLCNQKKAASIG